MKRKAKILSSIALILLLTGCGGGSIESRTDRIGVADTDETEDSVVGAEVDTAEAEPENLVLSDERTEQPEGNAVQEAGPTGEDAEQADQGESGTDDTPKEAPQLPETADGSRISCRTAGESWTVWNWISMRMASPIMWACCRRAGLTRTDIRFISWNIQGFCLP